MVRPRQLVVICAIAVSAVVSGVIAAASAETDARLEHKPVHHTAPTITANSEAGDLLQAPPGHWNGP